MPIPAQDLLSCLKQVAEQFHQTYTEESLISGLPVKGKQLPPPYCLSLHSVMIRMVLLSPS